MGLKKVPKKGFSDKSNRHDLIDATIHEGTHDSILCKCCSHSKILALAKEQNNIKADLQRSRGFLSEKGSRPERKPWNGHVDSSALHKFCQPRWELMNGTNVETNCAIIIKEANNSLDHLNALVQKEIISSVPAIAHQIHERLSSQAQNESEASHNLATSIVKPTKKLRVKREQKRELITPVRATISNDTSESKSNAMLNHLNFTNALWPMHYFMDMVFLCCKKLNPLTFVASMIQSNAKMYGTIFDTSYLPCLGSENNCYQIARKYARGLHVLEYSRLIGILKKPSAA